MRKQKVNKVLIANRAEIALRIRKACQKLGIECVHVCSEGDKNSLFARTAKELVVIGPTPAKESYLSVEKILKAAKETGCDAVHPGYGFLSENADFAEAVIKAGLIFIGPSPDSIRKLGDKVEARSRAKESEVPTTPGSLSGLDDGTLIKEAKRIGYPVIVKAVAGGGGRGMRVVANENELKEALPLARNEAQKFFNNADVYLEKYIKNPRHVEVQIFGDNFGNVVHFGTRDCSTQRRHQKIIEEAPAPYLSEKLREEIHQAAVRVAKSVGYSNAGTAEFLVEKETNSFYFLEMNTRIQVEHPITEVIAGVDLVQLQLKIAQGEKLPLTQNDIKFHGHAIEFRIYAEDPATNFSPTKGKISKLTRLSRQYLREDSGFVEGDDVSLAYDGMLSKLIVIGETRAEAILRSEEILHEYKLKGFKTNIPFLRWCIRETPFRKEPLNIKYLEEEISADKLKDFFERDVIDPEHVPPIFGAEKKEILSYYSSKFKEEYTVEILHRINKTFIAIPVSKKGQKAKPKYCRASNLKERALSCLIEDVLEKQDPKSIFKTT